MKRIFAILMALVVLLFTQCRPTPDGGDENESRKVKVRCEIPINEGDKSDFTNLLAEGKVNWSNGRECVYLAVHGENPMIIELEGWSDGTPSNLEFEGEAAEGLVVSGQEYDVWYFGHSQQLKTPYINMTDEDIRLEGSIANQSGRLEDIGYCHIAKTKVTAVTEDSVVRLNLKGTLANQIAIALLDLENVEELYGDAILGTEYALEYNGERYELNVTEDDNAKINVKSETGISYVVLLPNDKKETMIKHKKEDKTYAYTFHNYVKSNKIYYRTAIDGTTKEALRWSEYEEETSEIDGHEYVDLGLPSGLKWATCNVGANAPEEYGDYYAWGEKETKNSYSSSNSYTYEMHINEFSGNAQYDVARADWGGSWRMPTKDEISELVTYCTWTWTTQNSVNGYKVTGPNGKSVFLPAAGYNGGTFDVGSNGLYWSSTPEITPIPLNAYYLSFGSYGKGLNSEDRYYGYSIRPVSGGDFVEPILATVSTDEVTEITSSSAVCGVKIISDNGFAVSARGVCWSTSETPTISDNKISRGGSSDITLSITNLDPNTTYYVRAFAINAAGTSYGEQKSFTTLTAGPNANGHEYVDLGLSVKWATCNVGATSPEEYGNYYAWGETETKDEYTMENSITYNRPMNDISGDVRHDAATVNWGGTWRMPTKEEISSLLNGCVWEWKENGVDGYNGVNGYKGISKKNGNTIFLPASGAYDHGDGVVGYYWSSTPGDDYYGGQDFYRAYLLGFGSDFQSVHDGLSRNNGFVIRPVTE